MAVDSLLNLVPPTSRSPAWSAADRQQVEATLGTPLPSDRKQIIDRSTGTRWANFAPLLDPFSPNKHATLLEQSRVILDAERMEREQFPEHCPLPLFPAPECEFHFTSIASGTKRPLILAALTGDEG